MGRTSFPLDERSVTHQKSPSKELSLMKGEKTNRSSTDEVGKSKERSVTHMMPLHNEMEGSKKRSLTERDGIQQLTPHNLKGEGHSCSTNMRGRDTPLDSSSSLGEGKMPSSLETPSLTDQSHKMTPSQISKNPSHSHLTCSC